MEYEESYLDEQIQKQFASAISAICGMPDCSDMVGNYKSRLVCNTKKDDFVIDTVLVTDREFQYETAIQHNNFKDGEWIILGWRNTKEEAQKYHDEMVEYYSKNKIDEITDVYEKRTYYRKQTGQKFV